MEVIISRRRSKSDVTVLYCNALEKYRSRLSSGSFPGPGGGFCVEAVSGEKVKFFFNADVNLTSVVNLGYGEKKVH